MTEQFPIEDTFDGKTRWVYPHRVRISPSRVSRPVTVGGIQVGHIRPEGNQYFAFDGDRKHVGTFSRQGQAAKFLATSDHARQAYFDEARQGTFGWAAERWAHASQGSVIDNEYDDLPQVHISHSRPTGTGDHRYAYIGVNGVNVGTLLYVPNGGNDGEPRFFALDTNGAERGHSDTFWNKAVGQLLQHAGISSSWARIDEPAEGQTGDDDPADERTEFQADWDEAEASDAALLDIEDDVAEQDVPIEQVDPADTPEVREIAEAVREFDELPGDIRQEVADRLAVGDPVGRARVWREVSQPRNYTTTPYEAFHAALAVAQQHSGMSTHMLASQVREVMDLAGRMYDFCTEPLAYAHAPISPGPHLCGAPLNNGECPAVAAHRTTVSRGDRDRLLLQAKSALHRAVQQQAYTQGSDEVGEMLAGVEEQLRKTMELLAWSER